MVRDMNDDEEVWRDVPGCVNTQASSLGRVRTLGKGRWTVRKTHIGTHGYLVANVQRLRDGVPVRGMDTVHAMVCKAFHGPRPPGMYALHRDDCKLNNLPSNLRWGTPGDNLNDQKKNGKFGWHGVKKLSVECVREIDARLTAGVDYALIAEEFGITKSYVNAIARGAYYAAVTGRSSEDINPDRRRGEVFGTLNREMVMEITMMLDAGLPQKLIAKRAGVTPQNVSSINRGELWSWLTGRSPETARRPLKKGEFARQAGDRL